MDQKINVSPEAKAFIEHIVALPKQPGVSLDPVLAKAVEKEAEVVSRQKEGERKRKKGKAEPATAREKELDGKAAEVRDRRTKLAEFLKEFVDGYVSFASIIFFVLKRVFPACSSIGIVTSTPTSAPNAYEQ